MAITHKGYGKPCLQPLSRQFTRGYLSYRWKEAHGKRPSKRRLRRQIAALNKRFGKCTPVLMKFTIAPNGRKTER